MKYFFKDQKLCWCSVWKMIINCTPFSQNVKIKKTRGIEIRCNHHFNNLIFIINSCMPTLLKGENTNEQRIKLQTPILFTQK